MVIIIIIIIRFKILRTKKKKESTNVIIQFNRICCAFDSVYRFCESQSRNDYLSKCAKFVLHQNYPLVCLLYCFYMVLVTIAFSSLWQQRNLNWGGKKPNWNKTRTHVSDSNQRLRWSYTHGMLFYINDDAINDVQCCERLSSLFICLNLFAIFQAFYSQTRRVDDNTSSSNMLDVCVFVCYFFFF